MRPSPRILPRKQPRGQLARMLWDPGDRCELAVVVLDHATAMWAEWVEYDASAAVLARCALRAFRFFAGAPRWLVFEEPDCRVLGGLGEREIFQAPWPRVARHLCIGLKVQACRRAWVNDLSLRLWACGKEPWDVGGLAEANARLHGFLERDVLRARHRRWPHLTVDEVLRQERPWFLPLPDDLDVLVAGLEAGDVEDVGDG